MSYDETMAYGAAQYIDATTALSAAGLPTVFIQTGGMCAALETRLEAGYTLLITDAEDTLSWCRADQHGWWAGLYASGDGDGPIAWNQTDGSSVAALIRLVDNVLLQSVRTSRDDQRRSA